MLIGFVNINSALEVANFLWGNKQNLTDLTGHMGFVGVFVRKKILN